MPQAGQAAGTPAKPDAKDTRDRFLNQLRLVKSTRWVDSFDGSRRSRVRHASTRSSTRRSSACIPCVCLCRSLCRPLHRCFPEVDGFPTGSWNGFETGFRCDARYHLKGACQFGASCSFAHSCAELQVARLLQTQFSGEFSVDVQSVCKNNTNSKTFFVKSIFQASDIRYVTINLCMTNWHFKRIPQTDWTWTREFLARRRQICERHGFASIFLRARSSAIQLAIWFWLPHPLWLRWRMHRCWLYLCSQWNTQMKKICRTRSVDLSKSWMRWPWHHWQWAWQCCRWPTCRSISNSFKSSDSGQFISSIFLTSSSLGEDDLRSTDMFYKKTLWGFRMGWWMNFASTWVDDSKPINLSST